MDDPNITMEEYIRLEEEKACRRSKVYNWETTTYDKIGYDEDIHDLRSIETKFPTIVYNDALTSEPEVSSEPTLNMDDPNITMEEYIRLEEEKACRRGKVYNWETATYDKIGYDEDVHDLRSIETKFPGIVYNDALTSKPKVSSEPTDLAIRKSKIWYSLKKTCVELVRSILKPRKHTFCSRTQIGESSRAAYQGSFSF
nr:hypothetical protein [Tanacetum cinerariifolium]